jgi:hypothetical protein
MNIIDRPFTMQEVIAACERVNDREPRGDVGGRHDSATSLHANGTIAMVMEFCPQVSAVEAAEALGIQRHSGMTDRFAWWMRQPVWVRSTFRDCVDVELHRARDPQFGVDLIPFPRKTA